MQRDNVVTLSVFVTICLLSTGAVYLTSDINFVWLTVAISAFLCILCGTAIHFQEKRQQLYANRPSPPPFEAPVDNIIKGLNIDMMVFENMDREFFYVENLRHLTMADLDKIDLRRSVKCRLLECLHALVFHYPISAQLVQPDVFSV